MGNCCGVRRNKVDNSLACQKATPGITSVYNGNTHYAAFSSPKILANFEEKIVRRLPSSRTEGDILSSPNLTAFTLTDLSNATRNFCPSHLIGEGGFGDVYKGWIDEQTLGAASSGHGLVVAVKKLKPEGFQGHKEWLSEVNHLSQLHHPNLVKLIGYCLDGENRLLVYEYMPKGTLENHLFKSNNLEFNAKLSDFGLAKAGPTGDHTHVSTQVLGTQGYAAPEYIATGRLTTRCDVYSFGVVLLELLTGRRALDKTKDRIEQNLVDWAKPYLSDRRKLFRIMDTQLEGQYPQRAAFMVALLALHCISEAKLRPPMTEVLTTLEELPATTKNGISPSRSEQLILSSPSFCSPSSDNEPSPAHLTPRGHSLPTHKNSPTNRKPLRSPVPKYINSPTNMNLRGSPLPTHLNSPTNINIIEYPLR